MSGQFHEVLTGLTSTDNDLRSKAEAKYEEYSLTDRFTLLMGVLVSGNINEEIRQLSAVLLRRLITSSFQEAYVPLSDELKHGIKEQLLETMQMEKANVMRKKLGDCSAELARKLIDQEGNNTWPEILKFMFECISSENTSLKEVALHIFCQFSGIFGNQLQHYLEVLRGMLGDSMQQNQPPQIRFLAARATVAFLVNNESNTRLLKYCSNLLPGILSATYDSAADGDDEVMKSLVELCEDLPKYVRSHVTELLATCLKLVSDVENEESIRQLALEVMVTLAETAPGMFRKQKTLIPQLVPQVLALMIDFEEEDPVEWANSEEDEDEDSDSNPVAGENAIDRLSCALGGPTMLPHILATVPPMLQNPDWRYRHAGLMAISAVGEGCHKTMEKHLPQIVDAVIPYLSDSYPRVRYAACNAIGQMCTDFAPTMQKEFHEKIIVGLCNVLDDNQHPKVQAHSGAAMVNFIEECPKAILLPYLEPYCAKLEQVLMAKIQELVTKGTKIVLEQILTTIAAIADKVEEKFIVYYDRIMQPLKYILKAIMDQLLHIQADIESWESDDPQISYMMNAWARICKILGRDFIQYLRVVMPPLMKAAAIKPEVAMMDSQDADCVEDDDGWEFIKMGEQQSFGIRTSGLEQKSTACQMLVCYARELKEGFVDYAEEVVKLMVPLLKFFFHDGVRASAAESLPLLMECAQLRGDEYVTQMWSYIAPFLLEAVNTEPDADVLSIIMESLAKCIEYRGHGCFTMAQYETLAKTLNTMLEKHFTRAQERQEKRQDEDYDEEVEETLKDEDDEDVYILSKMADILHSLFGTHGIELFPFFDSLLPQYAKLISPDHPWPDRQWSLCVFDDIIEFTKEHSLKYKDVFLRPLLEYICDKSPEVRQAASYGVGVMAQFAGHAYADAIKEALPRLRLVIEGPMGKGVQGSLNHENIAPMENCISAICKVLKYQPQILEGSYNELLQAWLSWLPVIEDKEEAGHVYDFLCDIVESNCSVLGEGNGGVARAIVFFTDALSSSALEESEQVMERVIQLMKQIRNSASELWVNVMTKLPPVKTKAVETILEDCITNGN